MSKNQAIEIFLRVRPTKKPSASLNLVKEENMAEFFVPKDKDRGYVNNQKEVWKYNFNALFGMETKQEDIFEHIAKDVINSALEGYNGTIFAYGQTGSGKTFTMTGEAERYANRGLIPRTISYIFAESAKRTDTFIEVSISYIEIYNNDGYDLLDEEHTIRNLADLPKVIARDNGQGQILLSGLSVHKAQKEEDALDLLFIGDTNRVVSKTPKNDASTRSHCIFIIQLETKKAGSDIKTVSCIHLVDLSGSERVGKTGVEGKLLREATQINLSLHYLEHVIICLNKKLKGEDLVVPYRNSLMTLVLRDSIGGNCMTRMVATISAEEADIDESICTCQFAQRVALIKNAVSRNEGVDPALVIERLKRENAALKAELAELRGGVAIKDNLEANEIDECHKMVEEFLNSKVPGQQIVLTDRLRMNECFYHLRHLYKDLERRVGKGGIGGKPELKAIGDQNGKGNHDEGQNDEEIQRLKLLIQQRDNEIMILLNMIKKGNPGEQGLLLPVTKDESNASRLTGAPIGAGDRSTIIQGPEINSYALKESTPITFPQYQKDLDQMERGEDSTPRKKVNLKQGGLHEPMSNDKNGIIAQELQEVSSMLNANIEISNAQLMDRQMALEMFRKSYRKNEAMEESKLLLKQKIDKCKALGQQVNDARDKINQFKNRIEMLRKEKALQGLLNNQNEESGDPEEERYQGEIDRQKAIYKINFEKLREEKGEVERIQKYLEKSMEKRQQDFERWLAVMLNQRGIKVSLSNDLSAVSTYIDTKRPTNIKDEEVKKNLADFYKAKEELEKNSQTISNNSSGNYNRNTGGAGPGLNNESTTSKFTSFNRN